MRIVCTPHHPLHHGQFEFFRGEFVPCFEKPERADFIFKADTDHNIGPISAPDSFPLTSIERAWDM